MGLAEPLALSEGQGGIGVLAGGTDAQIWAVLGEWELISPHPGEPLGKAPNLQPWELYPNICNCS